MNITSLATIDSILCGTPVINIGFDGEGNYNSELEYLIESDFAKEFEQSEYVKPAKNLSAFNEVLKKMLEIKLKVKRTQIQDSLNLFISDISTFL
jgi:hypothetical protein